jgi:hypothetical protein
MLNITIILTDIILILMIVVFLLKLLCNLTFPYELISLYLKYHDTDRKAGMSIMPVEFGLWLIAVLVSAISPGEEWIKHPMNILKWGFVAIAISYAHMFIVYLPFACVMWLREKLKKNKS